MVNIFDKFDLSGKTAIVTGGAGLLGEEFCTTLCQAGAAVIIADNNGEAAEKLAASHTEAGYLAYGSTVDITKKESIRSMVDQASQVSGCIDILVNSAALDPKFDPGHRGDLPDSAFEVFSEEAWKQALDVNLTGMFLVTQAVVPHMHDQGKGVIVNLSSMYGVTGPDQRLYRQDGIQKQYKPVYYSVTKAGVLGFTKYLAAYYAGKQIRVNALTPGGVYNDHDSEFLEAYSTRAILGRMAEKDEMNGALLFLTSDASSYMTGANLIVDGGWSTW